MGGTLKKMVSDPLGALQDVLSPVVKPVRKGLGIPTMSELSGAEALKAQQKAIRQAQAGAAEMPVPSKDEQQAMLARRRAMAKRTSRGGRASTILTDTESLG